MGVSFKIKDIDYSFVHNNSANWRELVSYCPMLKSLFPDNFKKDDGATIKYKFKHNDKRLNELQSEVDKYLKFASMDVVYSLAKNIRTVILKTKSKKKDLEVDVLWL